MGFCGFLFHDASHKFQWGLSTQFYGMLHGNLLFLFNILYFILLNYFYAVVIIHYSLFLSIDLKI